MKKQTYWSSQSLRTLNHWQSNVKGGGSFPLQTFSFLRDENGNCFPLHPVLYLPNSSETIEQFGIDKFSVYSSVFNYSQLQPVKVLKYEIDDYTRYCGIMKYGNAIKMETAPIRLTGNTNTSFIVGYDTNQQNIYVTATAGNDLYVDVAIPWIERYIVFYGWAKTNVLPSWITDNAEDGEITVVSTYNPDSDLSTNAFYKIASGLKAVFDNIGFRIKHVSTSSGGLTPYAFLGSYMGGPSGFLAVDSQYAKAPSTDYYTFYEQHQSLSGIGNYCYTGNRTKHDGISGGNITPGHYSHFDSYYSGDELNNYGIGFGSGIITASALAKCSTIGSYSRSSSIFNNYTVQRYKTNDEVVGGLYISMITPITKVDIEEREVIKWV